MKVIAWCLAAVRARRTPPRAARLRPATVVDARRGPACALLSRPEAVAAALLALAGCASPDPAPGAEPPSRPPARPAEPAPPAPEPIVVKGIPLAHWEDPSSGPTATLVYVGESRAAPAPGARKPPGEAPLRPSVIITSSDPQNPHFNRRNTGVLTVQRTTKEELGQLLLELQKDGLDQLAWEDQPYDAEIGPERALYFYRDGKRQALKKGALSEPDKAVFSALEKRLIAHAQHFVEAGQR